MNIWVSTIGEPIPIDGENPRYRRIGNFAHYLAEQGHEVHWFSVSFNHYKKVQRVEQDTDIKLNDNLTLHVTRVRGYKKNISLGRVLNHNEIAKKTRARMEAMPKPDLIWASMEPLELSNQIATYGQQHSVPVLVDVRDLWPDMYYDMIPKSLHPLLAPYVWLSRRKLSQTMTRAYGIVGLSEGFLQYGLDYAHRARGESDGVFPIAYPNYPYEQFRSSFDACWSEYGVKSDDFIIAFLGNFGDTYVFESVIEASHQLMAQPKVKIVMCGTGIHLDEVKAKAAPNCIFPGWVEKEHIASLSACASLGIAPYFTSITYTRNTPNKVGEYLSASLPMLVGVTGTMQQLVEDYQCGMYYKDGSELTQAVLRYYNDPALLSEQSKNARAVYEAKFNGEVVNAQMMQFALKIAGMYQ